MRRILIKKLYYPLIYPLRPPKIFVRPPHITGLPQPHRLLVILLRYTPQAKTCVRMPVEVRYKLIYPRVYFIVPPPSAAVLPSMTLTNLPITS